MLAKTFSASVVGIRGHLITVEAAAQNALPQIHVTGLAGEVVRESRERIRACLQALGFDVPSTRIVVHLSPAMAKKQGSELDLAIAISILQAEGLLSTQSGNRIAYLGELSLDGKLHGMERSLSLLDALEKDPTIELIVAPREIDLEARLLGAKKVRLADHVGQVIDHLQGKVALEGPKEAIDPFSEARPPRTPLLSIEGQSVARRALQIAITGRHHLLMSGPPGTGKTLLAQSAPALLPPMAREEWLEWALASGMVSATSNLRERPFRAPHHTVSSAGLLGGGSQKICAGEVTFAHNGVLFLDEFPEFRKDAIEGLREPLQEGRIRLNRVGHETELPARFTLIAAMNPCPCGYAGSSVICRCSEDKKARYQGKASGPLLDRIGLRVQLELPESRGEMRSISHPSLEPSDTQFQKVVDQVEQACERQRIRYGSSTIRNGDTTTDLRNADFQIPTTGEAWLETTMRQSRYSLRSQHKWLRIARTIADLESSDRIHNDHLIEAKFLLCLPH